MSPSGQCQYHSSITALQLTGGMPKSLLLWLFLKWIRIHFKFLVCEATFENGHSSVYHFDLLHTSPQLIL